MWEYEHHADGRATPEAIWRVWADIANWPAWNPDIEAIELDGPLAPGTTIAMTPAGQDTVHLLLAEVVENEQFVDEARLGSAVVRTLHRVDRLDADHVRVTYRMQITGDKGARIGPLITADFPETIAALIERAGA